MPKKLTSEEFIKKAKTLHGDTYNYTKVEYKGNTIPILILCNRHGFFWQKPKDHLNGCGCPLCFKERQTNPRIKYEEFLERAKKIHKNKYRYIKETYTKATKSMTIICPEHGEFQQTPHNHLKGQGCPLCGNKRKGSYQNGTNMSFIRKSKDVHGNKYDYTKVNYVNNRVKVSIICPEHGEFQQKPLDHIHGCGCPECGKKLCKSEKQVLQILQEEYTNVEYQHKEPWLKSKTSYSTFDFYLSDYNIAIEYQGRQHLTPVKRFGGEDGFKLQYARDYSKYIKSIEHGVKIFYISFEKEAKNNYFEKIFTTTEDLILAINEFISSNNKTLTTN